MVFVEFQGARSLCARAYHALLVGAGVISMIFLPLATHDTACDVPLCRNLLHRKLSTEEKTPTNGNCIMVIGRVRSSHWRGTEEHSEVLMSHKW